MQNIEKLEVAVISNEVIKERLDEMRYGFLTAPKFQKNGVEFDIIFDLLIPINDLEHILTKSGSKYFLNGMTRDDYMKNIDLLVELIQISMKHTRRMFIQRNPDHTHVEILLFDKAYFIQELLDQFKEQDLN